MTDYDNPNWVILDTYTNRYIETTWDRGYLAPNNLGIRRLWTRFITPEYALPTTGNPYTISINIENSYNIGNGEYIWF